MSFNQNFLTFKLRKREVKKKKKKIKENCHGEKRGVEPTRMCAVVVVLVMGGS